jgi:hypothetical protein
MSNSWGHALEAITDEQREQLPEWDQTCRAGRQCGQQTAYFGSYNYVTGRAGRISWAGKYMCLDHGTRFQAKYGITEVPVRRSRPKHALERLLDGEPL